MGAPARRPVAVAVTRDGRRVQVPLEPAPAQRLLERLLGLLRR